MEKKIEEMARIYEFACDETEECTRKCGICHATLLYNAGYRKQQEVAKDIISLANELVTTIESESGISIASKVLFISSIKLLQTKIMERYGV